MKRGINRASLISWKKGEIKKKEWESKCRGKEK